MISGNKNQLIDQIDQDAMRAIIKTLHEQSRYYVAPIFWGTNPYDAGSILHNGSCFFVQIGEKRFGITAHHVIEQYLVDLKASQSVHMMIRNTEITDWPSRQIDSHSGLDLVTFRVTDQEFENISVRPIIAKIENWPPRTPEVGKGVFFTGYAGIDRRVADRKTVEFTQTSNGVGLTSVGPEELEIQIRKAELTPVQQGGEIPSVLKDLGGFSGAPVLAVLSSPSALFRLGGIMLKQVPAKNEDDAVTFIARRPDCIRPDGMLITTRNTR